LDGTTRNRQFRSLVAILTSLIGASRRPFIILDAPPAEQSRSDKALSARVAGLRGYLMAASQTYYVLKSEDARLTLDLDYFIQTVEAMRQSQTPFCVLGYTYVLYQHVVRPLQEKGIEMPLPKTTHVLHFGGWKKLQDQAVTKQALTAAAAKVFDLPATAIRDIYGFTEQLGVIYPDDADGIKRTPVYSEVLVRHPVNLEVVPDGEVGLLEFITPLPHSYPGVALLLDDMGRIVTRRPGSDGKQGTGFEVVGRAKTAEVRGCGDTLPAEVYEVHA
jgi:hypothetical protein